MAPGMLFLGLMRWGGTLGRPWGGTSGAGPSGLRANPSTTSEQPLLGRGGTLGGTTMAPRPSMLAMLLGLECPLKPGGLEPPLLGVGPTLVGRWVPPGGGGAPLFGLDPVAKGAAPLLLLVLGTVVGGASPTLLDLKLPIHVVGPPLPATGPAELGLEPPLLATGPAELGLEPPLLATGPAELGLEPPVVAVGPALLGLEPPVVAVSPALLGVGPPVLAVGPPVLGLLEAPSEDDSSAGGGGARLARRSTTGEGRAWPGGTEAG